MKRLLVNKTTGETKPSRWRVFLVQLFLLHAGVFAVGMISMVLVFAIFGMMGARLLFPVAGWGLVVAAHAIVTYLILNASIASGIVTVIERRKDPALRPLPRNATEIEELVAQGHVVLRKMEESAWSIPDLWVRSQAIETCEASQRVLVAIEEHPDEVAMAREFLHRFLEPAAKLIGDYARLARRNIPSAREVLREVEKSDLPTLTARAQAMFDRVHRGTLIDLAVAREMMALGVPDAGPDGAESKAPA